MDGFAVAARMKNLVRYIPSETVESARVVVTIRYVARLLAGIDDTYSHVPDGRVCGPLLRDDKPEGSGRMRRHAWYSVTGSAALPSSSGERASVMRTWRPWSFPTSLMSVIPGSPTP